MFKKKEKTTEGPDAFKGFTRHDPVQYTLGTETIFGVEETIIHNDVEIYKGLIEVTPTAEDAIDRSKRLNDDQQKLLIAEKTYL